MSFLTVWLLDILWTALEIFIETINRPQHCYESAYEVGLPSYTGGCQYSFDKQVDRQNIVLKIDSDDYPMKSDLHGLKCAGLAGPGLTVCNIEHTPTTEPPHRLQGRAGPDRVRYGAYADNGTPHCLCLTLVTCEQPPAGRW